MTRAIWLVSVGALVIAGCKHAEPPPVNASTVEEERNASVQAQPTAPLFEGLGDFSHAITTSNGKTQRYFDQGMVLSFGFNHAEAERSFRHAAALDEGCAMCWWGVAYVLGPNINAPMSPEAGTQAWEALQRAQALVPNVSPEEQDYITALATRYAETPTEDRTSLNEAYAEAMKALSAKYPNDVDARVLGVEALMDLHPWDFWDLKTGKAQPWTPEIVSMLEDTLARAPNHPMANHLYIHLVEASHEPERALPSAKRLPELTPGAGHLVHMPAHVYIRVGEYHEASEANEAAIEADQAYITQCRAQGIYPLAYHPHNYHFLSRTASLEGRSAKALEAANRMKAHVPTDQMRQPGLTTLQHYWVTPLYVMAQFGMWDRILSYPKPDDDLVYPIGVWHYARGLAFAADDLLAEAKAELTELRKIVADDRLEGVTVWDINSAQSLMRIAERVLAGEIAAKRGQWNQAITLLKEAVELQDAQNYDEPPSWYSSTRNVLGALYLQAGKPKAAERVYREDLAVFPNNGWALLGLSQALRAQGKHAAAAQAKSHFEAAWSKADIELTASSFR
ncbi:MAG: tetratricopeptide repeat protein [Myxococcales bacterium]|nr:tetratricopeptide repeat protein [Myxococcales bacterium]MDH3843481.1 tetratricopeptide repeat protein [Myxococcales bacterium]